MVPDGLGPHSGAEPDHLDCCPARALQWGDFNMPSDENAHPFERQCPVCRGPIQVVRVESGVPGLPPGRQRQMIKCSRCELVATHTFDLEYGTTSERSAPSANSAASSIAPTSDPQHVTADIPGWGLPQFFCSRLVQPLFEIFETRSALVVYLLLKLGKLPVKHREDK